jgi:bifunctional non-homologous end joining protein LigD
MYSESIRLSFTQGSSNKVYHVSLDPKDDGYLVNFAYGRRNGTLKLGTKTAKPLPYDQAKYAYDKLVKEKMAKGYTPAGTGIPFSGTVRAPERTDYLPQLLNPIELEDVPEALLRADGVLALQVKHDGERRIVVATPDDIYGSNRKGLRVELSTPIKEALSAALLKLGEDRLVLDTEDMGDHLQIFDVIEVGEKSYMNAPFELRAQPLCRFMELYGPIFDCLRPSHPIYTNSVDYIHRFAAEKEAANEEGIVLRDTKAVYTPGRPNSWGPCLKLKFYATATCIVGNTHPTKRSIALTMLQDGSAVEVGNCTIPPNYAIPSSGDLVEIKYLYAYRGGSLYQPQYKGLRTDIELADAVLSQLKYKD